MSSMAMDAYGPGFHGLEFEPRNLLHYLNALAGEDTTGRDELGLWQRVRRLC